MSIIQSDIYSFYNNNIHEWMNNQRMDVRIQYLESLELNPGSRVLDVGCGCGLDMNILETIYSGVKGKGIDFSPEAISIAKNNVNVNNWDLECVNFFDYKDLKLYDAVIFSMAIMHYKDLNEVFQTLSKFVRKKGKLLVVTNNPYIICNDYDIEYINKVSTVSYTHKFIFDGKEHLVKKYLHRLSSYTNISTETNLKLIKMIEIMSYNDDTKVFNPNKHYLPNFLAFVYEKC